MSIPVVFPSAETGQWHISYMCYRQREVGLGCWTLVFIHARAIGCVTAYNTPWIVRSTLISDIQTCEKVFLLEAVKCRKWTNKQNKEGREKKKLGRTESDWEEAGRGHFLRTRV